MFHNNNPILLLDGIKTKWLRGVNQKPLKFKNKAYF